MGYNNSLWFLTISMVLLQSTLCQKAEEFSFFAHWTILKFGLFQNNINYFSVNFVFQHFIDHPFISPSTILCKILLIWSTSTVDVWIDMVNPLHNCIFSCEYYKILSFWTKVLIFTTVYFINNIFCVFEKPLL